MKSILFIAFLIVSYSFYIGHEKSKRTDPPDFLPYSQNIPASDVSVELIPVSGGTFMMGSPEREAGRDEGEGPLRKVKVNSFWMGTYEITWEQYDLFVNEEISNLKNVTSPLNGEIEIEVDAISSPTRPYIDMSFGMGRDGYPAINMTYYAAVMFSKWLSAKTGHFYRLPTEAEWEYACRAGTNTAYYFGDNQNKIDEYAWSRDNSEGSYKKIGTKKPNALGLYDMHGNVAEWTVDQYKEKYREQLEGEVADNPWVKPTELYPHSVRGGSWMDVRDDLRCAKRKGSSKEWKKRDPQLPKSLWWFTDAPFVGFRLIRPQQIPSKEEMEKYWIDAIQDI
jgi:formylglycine-generating enzyme required for sulfatase activity